MANCVSLRYFQTMLSRLASRVSSLPHVLLILHMYECWCSYLPTGTPRGNHNTKLSNQLVDWWYVVIWQSIVSFKCLHNVPLKENGWRVLVEKHSPHTIQQLRKQLLMCRRLIRQMWIEQVWDIWSLHLFILMVNKVEAATRAFYHGPWSNTGGYERGRILNRLADLIEKHKEELAQLEGLFDSF